MGGTALVLGFGIVIGLNVGRFSQPEPPMAASDEQAARHGNRCAASYGEPGKPIPPGVLAGMLSAARQSLMAGR